MKFTTIRDKVIKPKLIDMLGNTMAKDMFTKARFASANERDEKGMLKVFVTMICSDPKFLGMWGTAQAEKQKMEWLELLS